MDKRIYKYLYDIKESIHSINDFLGEKRDFNVYLSNKMMRRAVEREFEIIGEAMNRIIKIDSSINISNKSSIMAMRNRVIHGYDKGDDEIVWGTIVRHLPTLLNEVKTLINEVV